MRRGLQVISLWLPAVAYGGGVYYFSSLSRVRVSGLIPDYVSHPLEYAGLTLLILRALNGGLRRPIPGPVHFWGVGMAVAYAISDEIHQLQVPRRTASLKDVLSDALGALLAVGIAELIQRSTARPSTGRPLSVTLYTRRQCHLCHDARDILARVSRGVPLRISEVDVDGSPELAARYGEEVPVILAAGNKISKLHPDEAAIRRRLTRVASRPR